jgi:hypothetical protein
VCQRYASYLEQSLYEPHDNISERYVEKREEKSKSLIIIFALAIPEKLILDKEAGKGIVWLDVGVL